MTLSVGFAGMTHLGLVYSAATASKNLNVICYDNNPTLIGNINSGLIPVMEEAGWSENRIRKVLGENWFKFLDEVWS